MDVTIEPFIGKSVATGQPVRYEQYRIRVDGKHAGYVGFAPNSPVLLTNRFGPVELKEIESKVAELLERDDVSTNQVPEVSEEMLRKPEEMEAIDDDFDA